MPMGMAPVIFNAHTFKHAIVMETAVFKEELQNTT